MRSLPDDNARQTAIANLVTRVDRDQADVALGLVGEMQDDSRKQKASLNLAVRWTSENPSAIEQIINDLNLSKAKSNQLRDFLKNNRRQL